MEPTPSMPPTPTDGAATPRETEADGGLTADQALVVAKALYGPTIDRLSTLVWAMVQQSGNGDWTLWAPLATIERCLTRFAFEKVQNETDRRGVLALLTLIETTCLEYGERMGKYADEVRAYYGAGSQGPFPVKPTWSQADTEAMYDRVLQIVPPPGADDAPPTG